jgi:hypothetical protein
MKIYYSKSTSGFYNDDIHGPRTLLAVDEGMTDVPNPDCKIPTDAVEITEEEHQSLLAAQSSGKIIMPDANGNPVAVDSPPPSPYEVATAKRLQRDAALSKTDWAVIRHRDESEAGASSTLSDDQYKSLLSYRQALRDLTKVSGFPDVSLPDAPSFI